VIRISVREIITKNVVAVTPNTPIRRVAEIMHNNNIGSVLIVDNDGRLLGIFTERDLVKAVALGVDLNTPVENFMTTKLVTATPNESIASIAHKMIENWIRHIPVVDEQNRAIGVLSIRDVLRAYIAGLTFP